MNEPTPDPARDSDPALDSAVAEIEAHLQAAGWDRGPSLFALVRADRFTTDDPQTARRLGVDALPGHVLTPVEQDELPDGTLDEMLAGIAWPDSVAGCAVSQEIVVLPPSAEARLASEQLPASDLVARAADHPDRREARLVVGVLRGGAASTLLRLRSTDRNDPAAEDDLLTGPDLAPNLVAALFDTLA